MTEPAAAPCNFYDEKSRADVTLQSSEIVEISRDEFNSGLTQ
jgi:hypothetical protein